MKVKPNHGSSSIWKCKPPSGQKYYAVFHEEHQRISCAETLYFFMSGTGVALNESEAKS